MSVKPAAAQSLFLRLPVPQIVLAEVSNGRYIVIDGKQRLTAIAKFALPSFVGYPLKLSRLDYRKELSEKDVVGISSDSRLRPELDAFNNHTIRTIVVRHWGDEKLLYLLFLRLNQNSVTLSPQELRGALHPGHFVKFVEEWTGSSAGMKVIFSRIPDFRMRDVELAIRFFGFHFFSHTYSGNMKGFLDQTTQALNRSWKQKKESVVIAAKSFDASCDAAEKIFEGK